ncbi:hypothetical protein AALB39_23905 [Lachnospiraceae bacterium 54-53]
MKTGTRTNKVVWAIGAVGAFLMGFLLCRYVFPDLHGMKEWPFLLFMAGLITIIIAAIFSARKVMVLTIIGYIGGFVLGMLFDVDGTDPGGGRTNNAWIGNTLALPGGSAGRTYHSSPCPARCQSGHLFI